jgi:hypothetical protein
MLEARCAVALALVLFLGPAACGGGGGKRSWPPPQSYPTLVYVADAGLVLKVGGTARGCFTTNMLGNDGVWAFDVGAGTWEQLVGRTPFVTDGVAYHSGAGKLIAWRSFVEGSTCEAAPTSTAQTWAFDWRTGTWENRAPKASPPKGLIQNGDQILAYDEEARKVILFGGFDWDKYVRMVNGEPIPAEEIFSDQTWAYDYEANTWTNMQPEGPPARRNSHSLVYDKVAKKVILFGGGGVEGTFDDTWAYDYGSNTWTDLQPAPRPSSRDYTGLAFDEDAGTTVLFGGTNAAETEVYDDTWTYDFEGNAWTLRSPGTAPSARAWLGLSYGGAPNTMVLFGGGPARNRADAETWLYSTADDTWREVVEP